jgi:hypothetical protein
LRCENGVDGDDANAHARRDGVDESAVDGHGYVARHFRGGNTFRQLLKPQLLLVNIAGIRVT